MAGPACVIPGRRRDRLGRGRCGLLGIQTLALFFLSLGTGPRSSASRCSRSLASASSRRRVALFLALFLLGIAARGLFDLASLRCLQRLHPAFHLRIRNPCRTLG